MPEKKSTNFDRSGVTLQDSGDNVAISVVVPCYNAQTTIRHCLKALGNQSIPPEDYEVIVVDSSKDQTPRIIGDEYPWVRLLHRDTRIPAGAARNLGVEIARGNIIAFADSDCIVDRDWLRMLQETYLAWPDIAGVGGSIINGNPEVFWGWITFLIEFAGLLPTGSIRKVHGIVVGANSSFKRWAFEKYEYAGNLPLDVGGEDTLFNWSLIRAGEILLFNPKAHVHHLNRGKLRLALRHLHHLGYGVAWVRLHYHIPYSFLAQSRISGFLIMPIRTARTIWRTLIGTPLASWRLLLLWPFILLGYIYFGLGEAKCISDFSKQ